MALTPNGDLLLVDQYRPPVNARVIELPAGLVGDDHSELPVEAAQRELLEETGYEAQSWKCLVEGPLVPGISNEWIHLFLASSLVKVNSGGGVGNEDIIVHEVPRSTFTRWLADMKEQGRMIDPKIFTLWFYTQSLQDPTK
tara:strand:+ start:135 stop:557 length:423 start_codon:yes stop_codon:yes gene_type:complete